MGSSFRARVSVLNGRVWHIICRIHFRACACIGSHRDRHRIRSRAWDWLHMHWVPCVITVKARFPWFWWHSTPAQHYHSMKPLHAWGQVLTHQDSGKWACVSESKRQSTHFHNELLANARFCSWLQLFSLRCTWTGGLAANTGLITLNGCGAATMPHSLIKRLGLGNFANVKRTAATKSSDARDLAGLSFHCRGDGECWTRITHVQR